MRVRTQEMSPEMCVCVRGSVCVCVCVCVMVQMGCTGELASGLCVGARRSSESIITWLPTPNMSVWTRINRWPDVVVYSKAA